MDNLQKYVENYLKYCQTQKRLDEKTLRAYRTDLAQFCEYSQPADILEITPELLENFFGDLHQKYKPKCNHSHKKLFFGFRITNKNVI